MLGKLLFFVSSGKMKMPLDGGFLAGPSNAHAVVWGIHPRKRAWPIAFPNPFFCSKLALHAFSQTSHKDISSRAGEIR
jgi:hypothetical protein